MAYQAIAFPTFQPAMRIITNITNAYPAVVTTSFDNQYITGTIVRLYIPEGYSMVQANQLFGEIVVLTPTTFEINIDTRLFDPFIIPDPQLQYAQCVPIGEVNELLSAATQNVLPY
jgi:hypothetical protein